jgi:hypothetical protein
MVGQMNLTGIYKIATQELQNTHSSQQPMELSPKQNTFLNLKQVATNIIK